MKNKKLPSIDNYPTMFAIIGIMAISSIFIGTRIAGLTLIILGIFSFFSTYYNSKLETKKVKKK